VAAAHPACGPAALAPRDGSALTHQIRKLKHWSQEALAAVAGLQSLAGTGTVVRESQVLALVQKRQISHAPAPGIDLDQPTEAGCIKKS
jgi:hypothetical protein